jgi:hypothetical protein
MLTPAELERLESFDGGPSPALTVYLDLDPARQVRHSYRIAFEDLVKEARERLPEAARADLAREVATVQAWLETQEPHGKGLVVVSCAPAHLWHANVLRVRVTDHLAFEPRPDVGLLLELVDEHERYAVVLVDKDQARVFTVFLGEIEAVEDLREEALPPRPSVWPRSIAAGASIV